MRPTGVNIHICLYTMVKQRTIFSSEQQTETPKMIRSAYHG